MVMEPCPAKSLRQPCADGGVTRVDASFCWSDVVMKGLARVWQGFGRRASLENFICHLPSGELT